MNSCAQRTLIDGGMGGTGRCLAPRWLVQTGFTYLGIVALVAMLGAVAGTTARVWHTAVQWEKERQLLLVGQQFRLAIKYYYRNIPGRK